MLVFSPRAGVARRQDTFSCFAKYKVSKKKATPLPFFSFGLSATLVRLRNSRFQRLNSRGSGRFA
jgi:hypothetical protein